MIEMTIDSLRVGMMKKPQPADAKAPYVLFLKEKKCERYLFIFVSVAEANALAIKLRGEQIPRPLTHDLFRSVVDAFGGSIDSVVINEFKDDIFYAKLVLSKDGKIYELDSRPGDAITMALTSPKREVPIFATESIMQQKGATVKEFIDGFGRRQKIS